jgi:hypothetical protein
MSNPHEDYEPDPSIPQFDRAEFEPGESGRPFCRVCRLPLEDEYYDVGGNVVCPACLVKTGRPRARFLRAAKAFLFGSIAATVGAAIYRAILFGSGWNIGLVAIVVGYMVGGAVRTGSGERGGRFYQFLAVFLTYSAIVGMFVPGLWQAMASGAKARKEARKIANKDNREQPKGDLARQAGKQPDKKAAPPQAGARPDAIEVLAGPLAEARLAADAPDVKDRPPGAVEKPRPRSVLYRIYLVGMLLLSLLLLVGLMYLFPLYLGFHSPISLLIYAFALWEAWKMNRGVDATVTGPYRVRG